MTSELHEGPLAQAQPAKKTWREKRWERRRRRIWFEEILGWLLVPVILFVGYWALVSVLAAFGTTPGQIVDVIKAVLSGGR